MKRIILFTFLSASAIWTGCQKIDVDEPITGTPVFYADFTVDGTMKNWKAGENDYYMFAAFGKDDNDVFVFTSSLRKENCPGLQCAESLNIFIRDFQQTPVGNPDVELALMKPLKFFSPLAGDTAWVDSTYVLSYQVQFDGSPSLYPQNAIPVFSWNLGNGSAPDNSMTPSANYPSLFPPIPVSLTVVASNTGCSSTQTQYIHSTANPAGPSGCSVQVLFDTASNQLMTVASGTPPFSYLWSDSSSGPTIPAPNNPQLNIASVTVTDADGCQASTSVFFQNPFGALPQFCSAGFTYMITELDTTVLVPVLQTDPFQFSSVIIEYTDGGGIPYTSAGVLQDSSANFEIVAVEDFGENENGEQTKKLHVNFTCRVASQNGTVRLVEGDAVIAVAYPD